ncbi:MAG: GNAT family N-acetyltransferase [Myxococcaceae bacterium]
MRNQLVVAAGRTVEVELARESSERLETAVARLLPQLSSARPPNGMELAEILESPGTKLFVARVDEEIVGILTLVVVRIPSGVRAWIEDVIVDEAQRGRGIGEALTRTALQEARVAGARSVDLTSRPIREAANRLYERCGFVRRDTNYYRYTL